MVISVECWEIDYRNVGRKSRERAVRLKNSSFAFVFQLLY
jgi:hypothetical protein